MGLITKLFGTYSQRELKRIYPIQEKVLALEERFRNMSDQELKACTPAFKERLAKGETLDDLLPEAFACCREAASRVLNMRHFPVQIIGGIVLHQGRIAEMRTGEGKTLVATLPVYLNALTGKGVHVVTVNDYLAKRDSEWMGKVYRFLGLSVGLVVHAIEPHNRKVMYDCDIVYGTNNEFGFDYLRDNMATYRQNCVQRGHYFAVVDEVDSILVDEARTPLIISGQGDKSTEMYARADQFARGLKCHRITETDTKVEHDDVDGDYIVDEKAKSVTLTPSGIKKAEAFFGLENLTDPDNMTISHHINQAIKAHGNMRRDVDYVVKDGEIIIVDEFTGRLMMGRRYNEGLHQAIEAKEGVEVKKESKTLATITFQNFFRMYDKLAGMTGTASTEADEFMQIYKLDVIEIPTNKPVLRADHHDVVYKTEKAKFEAVIDQIAASHEKGQPVLVGTVSIEKSEQLSKMLSRRGIKHQVLNAKFHEKEAQIIAQAGKMNAVTIATNMAGRGTDIMLGGNAEYLAKSELQKQGYDDEIIAEATGYADTDNQLIVEARKLYGELMEQYREEISSEAEKVRAAGGLFIVGTERHESRRIDNQLRGRAGRQGDPGETRFYLSLEDDLMRLFGGERIGGIMDMLGAEENMPIEAKILSNSIESAQNKVEARNFGIRKNVLQYDDVMNRQREIIYAQRGKVLDGEDVSGVVQKMIDETISDIVSSYCVDKEDPVSWNIHAIRTYFLGWLLTENDLQYTDEQMKSLKEEEITDFIKTRASEIYQKREEVFTAPIMREIERVVLLQNVDRKWMQHIDDMDELKRGMSLRGYAQRDPVVDYRLEGFEMFDAMIAAIREDTVKQMYTFRLNIPRIVRKDGAQEPLPGVDAISAVVERQPKTPVQVRGTLRALGGAPTPASKTLPEPGTVPAIRLRPMSAPDKASEGSASAAGGSTPAGTAGFPAASSAVSPSVSGTEQTAATSVQSAPTAGASVMPQRVQVMKPTSFTGASDGSIGNAPVRRSAAKVGRNDPCPCGSGKKYKKCCGK